MAARFACGHYIRTGRVQPCHIVPTISMQSAWSHKTLIKNGNRMSQLFVPSDEGGVVRVALTEAHQSWTRVAYAWRHIGQTTKAMTFPCRYLVKHASTIPSSNTIVINLNTLRRVLAMPQSSVNGLFRRPSFAQIY